MMEHVDEYCDGCGRHRERPRRSRGPISNLSWLEKVRLFNDKPWVHYHLEDVLLCPECVERREKPHCQGCGKKWSGEPYEEVGFGMFTPDKLFHVPWFYLPCHNQMICPNCTVYGQPEKEEQPMLDETRNAIRDFIKSMRADPHVDSHRIISHLRGCHGEVLIDSILKEIDRADNCANGLHVSVPDKKVAIHELRDKHQNVVARIEGNNLRVMQGWVPEVVEGDKNREVIFRKGAT